MISSLKHKLLLGLAPNPTALCLQQLLLAQCKWHLDQIGKCFDFVFFQVGFIRGLKGVFVVAVKKLSKYVTFGLFLRIGTFS